MAKNDPWECSVIHTGKVWFVFPFAVLRWRDIGGLRSDTLFEVYAMVDNDRTNDILVAREKNATGVAKFLARFADAMCIVVAEKE